MVCMIGQRYDRGRCMSGEIDTNRWMIMILEWFLFLSSDRIEGGVEFGDGIVVSVRILGGRKGVAV